MTWPIALHISPEWVGFGYHGLFIYDFGSTIRNLRSLHCLHFQGSENVKVTYWDNRAPFGSVLTFSCPSTSDCTCLKTFFSIYIWHMLLFFKNCFVSFWIILHGSFTQLSIVIFCSHLHEVGVWFVWAHGFPGDVRNAVGNVWDLWQT